MKVKVGDQVKILAGKDKNKEGKIIKTLNLTNMEVRSLWDIFLAI